MTSRLKNDSIAQAANISPRTDLLNTMYYISPPDWYALTCTYSS